MNGYLFLGRENEHELRLRRVRELERDHFVTALLLEESPEDATTRGMMADIERRIDHHVSVLDQTMKQVREDSIPQVAPIDDLPGEPG